MNLYKFLESIFQPKEKKQKTSDEIWQKFYSDSHACFADLAILYREKYGVNPPEWFFNQTLEQARKALGESSNIAKLNWCR